MFFDISKAFDTVSRLPLFQQMEKLGLNPYLLRWIRNYLIERTQHVVVDGCSSQALHVFHRDQYLGPCCLFVIYMMLLVLPWRGVI